MYLPPIYDESFRAFTGHAEVISKVVRLAA
jgi:hypothetical protein